MSRHTLFAIALLAALCSLSSHVCAQSRDDRAQAAAEIESLREQLKARESILLATSTEDREAYAEFLAQPGAGLTRLLPRGKWDGKLSVRGGGAYFSFTRLTHEYGSGSDIELQQGNFHVGFAGADFGFLVNVGEVPLEKVSTLTEAVQFMATFEAPTGEREARKLSYQFGGGGQRSGPWTYQSTLPVVVNSTYALRSINYDETDVLVAFRVIRRDSDGSVVLLWKMLKGFPRPELERSPPPPGPGHDR